MYAYMSHESRLAVEHYGVMENATKSSVNLLLFFFGTSDFLVLINRHQINQFPVSALQENTH